MPREGKGRDGKGERGAVGVGWEAAHVGII